MNLVDAIFLAIMLLLMSVIVFRDFRYTFRKRASEKWPTMQATIESATVRRGGPALYFFLMYRVYFTYSYCVNDIRYTGLFVLVADNKKSGEGLQQALAGKRVLIRYDTRHPGVSFLFDQRMIGKRIMQHPLWT